MRPLVFLLCALPRVIAAAETTFDEAVSKIDQRRPQQAMADLTELANRGDARAQYFLGLAYLEAKWVERDIPRALSWLQIAADGYRGSFATSASDDAREALLKVAPHVAGPDLIKADQITAGFLSAYNTTLDAAEERGRTLLMAAAKEGTTTDTSGVATGCALGSNKSRCPPPVVDSTGERCRGAFPKVEVPATIVGQEKYLRQPTYPVYARQWSWEGKVMFLSHIDSSGLVCRVTLVQDSGFPLLDRAALDAVRTWRWTPAQLNGQPVESIQTASATFLMTDLQLK
jgi:TonB family protein